jgi:hypothetical protein
VRLLLSTVLLSLAWFAAINLAASAVAWLAARPILKRGATVSGTLLLILRLAPAGLSTLLVALIFVPAHLRFEPAESDERFGFVLSTLAVLGFGLLARSAYRLFRASAAARRVRAWMLVPVDSTVGEAYEVSGFPGVSLAGIVRTRILIGASARVTLTPDELNLALAHEHAHRRSLDNLKRCAMFCAADFFGWSGTAAQVEEQWRAQAEREADRRAVAGDERRAMHLASALVKVARLGAAGSRLTSPVWSTFNEPPLLEVRVRSLVSGSSSPQPVRRLRQYGVLGLAAMAAAAIWFADTSFDVHVLTEAFVSRLP